MTFPLGTWAFGHYLDRLSTDPTNPKRGGFSLRMLADQVLPYIPLPVDPAPPEWYEPGSSLFLTDILRNYAEIPDGDQVVETPNFPDTLSSVGILDLSNRGFNAIQVQMMGFTQTAGDPDDVPARIETHGNLGV
ncbi:MAG: hypothetical protein ABI743_06390, partial [bacterium]